MQLKILFVLNGAMTVFFSSKSSNSRGVGILFIKNVDFKIHDYKLDDEGNYIILDITVENNRFNLITLYGPNTDSPMFFEDLINKSHQFNNNTSILCGDFNCVQDTTLDYYNYKCINNKKAHKKL